MSNRGPAWVDVVCSILSFAIVGLFWGQALVGLSVVGMVVGLVGELVVFSVVAYSLGPWMDRSLDAGMWQSGEDT